VIPTDGSTTTVDMRKLEVAKTRLATVVLSNDDLATKWKAGDL
jgi:hypothetical protein